MQNKTKAALIAERNSKLSNRYKLQVETAKLSKEIEDLTHDIDNYPKPAVLVITDHAIERFKQRIVDMPDTKIKKVLAEKELVEKFNRRGDGRYQLKSNPNIIAVVKDEHVVTILNKFDYRVQLTLMEEYMMGYIDRLILKYIGEPVTFNTFNYFKKKKFK